MSLEYHKEEYGHWTSDEDDDDDDDVELEIEEYDSEDEETNISDDPNNNKNQQSKIDANNVTTSTNKSVSYFSRSRLNNTKSCYQLQDMSLNNPSRTQNSFSNPQHVPKTQSMAFDFEWDDNEERKVRNRPCGGEKVLLL